MFAIYKREMRSYFTTPIGYIFAAVYLALGAAVFCYSTLYALSADTGTYFTIMLFSLVVLLPLLTMKTFSEERKSRTEQLLLSAPVTLTGMVLGKFLAAFSVFFGCTLLSSLNFIILYRHAEPNTAMILGNLLALLLVGMAFLAIGMLVSALTESQLSAAVNTSRKRVSSRPVTSTPARSSTDSACSGCFARSKSARNAAATVSAQIPNSDILFSQTEQRLHRAEQLADLCHDQ